MDSIGSNGRKPFKTYSEQVAILESRGMQLTSHAEAEAVLRRVNYYRLSAYWYPYRAIDTAQQVRIDRFLPGTRFDDVVDLYEFDDRLRAATFEAISAVELAMRALLGHELGRIDPCIHLQPELLGHQARDSNGSHSDDYVNWRKKLKRAISLSQEDFVKHHEEKYGGVLPVWVVVELLDWGSLSWLYTLAPEPVRTAVAERTRLTPSQLASWLKSLNVVRNVAAHHGRMFNRVYGLKPKLPCGGHPGLERIKAVSERSFGQLSLVQYLHRVLELGGEERLPETLETFPAVGRLFVRDMGAPQNWRENPLWQ